MRIAVINNPTVFELLTKFSLEHSSFIMNITGVSDGENFVNNTTNSNKQDLVLINSSTTNAESLKLCNKIKQNKAFENTKVVFLVDKPSREFINSIIESGANDYISDYEDSFSLVAQIIGILEKQ